MLIVVIAMTALLLASSHNTGISVIFGMTAVMTCGIESPMMMQNAIMPPKALSSISDKPPATTEVTCNLQGPLCNLYSFLLIQHMVKTGQGAGRSYRYRNQSRLAKAGLHRRLERVGTTQLRVDDDEVDCPINLIPLISAPSPKNHSWNSIHTTIVNDTNRKIPAPSPACRNA
jgi:hypothetical protein